jgi:hypothetical protein
MQLPGIRPIAQKKLLFPFSRRAAFIDLDAYWTQPSHTAWVGVPYSHQSATILAAASTFVFVITSGKGSVGLSLAMLMVSAGNSRW